MAKSQSSSVRDGEKNQPDAAECQASVPEVAAFGQHRDGGDGDADLEAPDFNRFQVPSCSLCGGLLKPDVVFFGESVPSHRVDLAMLHLRQADALLVVGSSLMVYSGYRFAQAAATAGKPIAAVNLGHTRADALLSLKVSEPCAAALAFLLPSPGGVPPADVPPGAAAPSATLAATTAR